MGPLLQRLPRHLQPGRNIRKTHQIGHLDLPEARLLDEATIPNRPAIDRFGDIQRLTGPESGADERQVLE